MSKLPTRASGSISTLAKIPDASISLVVRLQLLKPPKQAANGNNTPGNLIITVCEKVTVPYAFVKPSARPGQQPKNKIDTPLSQEQVGEIMILQPGQNYSVSMFNTPTTLTLGNLFRLDGLFRNAYMGPRKDPITGQEVMMTEPELRLTCMRISAVTGDLTDDEFDNKIEFDQRSFNLERDVPGEDRLHTYVVEEFKTPYHSVITLLGVDTDEPGTLTGNFMPPVEGNIPSMTYEPFNVIKGGKEVATIALTGGTNGTDSEKAQLCIQQNMLDGRQVVLKCFTRVYHNAGLNKFQMDWKKMGHILAPIIIGKANCTVDRAQTKELQEDESDDIYGVLALNVVIRPDMAAMSKKRAYKITWASCLMLDDSLKSPESLITEEPQVRIQDATALNILRYSGNASLLPKAEKRGWVEFYVWTNMPMEDEERRAEIRAMTEEQLVSEFRNKKFYGGIQPYINIFAVPTETCECKLHELVSSRGTPSGALLFDGEKRARVEE